MRSHALLWLAALGLVSACVEQAPDTPSEADLTAARQHILKEPPAKLKFPVNAELEGKLVYLGCDTDADTLKPGQAFTITHYWKVIQPVGDDWKMFVHMNGQGGKQPFVNLDHGPVGGKYPVSFWKAGEVIRDVHRITLPANWGSPKAEVYTGVFKGNIRLKVTKGAQDGQNRILAVSLPVSTAAAPVAKEALKRYVARKVAAGAVKVDGKLDEAAWKDAASTGLFVSTMNGSPAPQATEAKLLWDEKNLYVGFQLKDTNIWGTMKNRDDELWKEEAVELFIDWSGTGKNYIEIQVNPRGTVFDSFLTDYRKHWKKAKEYDFDSGVVAKVTVDGTIDNLKDQDKGWVVEMAIPLAKLQGPAEKGPSLPPKPGDVWRVNLFRVDRPAGPGAKDMVASAWSPPMVGDFHAVKRFGELVFGDEKGVAPQKAAAPAPGAPAGAAAPASQAGAPKVKVMTAGGKQLPLPLRRLPPLVKQPAAPVTPAP
jgi:hypothetical protein